MYSHAEKILRLAEQAKKKIVTAESCTGGLLAAVLTEVPGASHVLERGYVAYSNAAKIELLTVPTMFIEDYGAVSKETAIAMAEGALLTSRAQISIAITGIAGPEGGSEAKPVGTVFIARSNNSGATEVKEFHFTGTRTEIRTECVKAALVMLEEEVRG